MTAPEAEGAGRRIVLVTANLAPYDAIGNDVLGMERCLRQAGFSVRVLAGDVSGTLPGEAERLDLDSQDFWRDPETLLVYHHSMGWPLGQDLLEATRNRVAVKYHNITPPRFFEPYSATYSGACRAGELANYRVASHYSAVFWGDSTYNCRNLARHGAPPERCRVLPPFHRAEELASQPLDRALLGRWRGAPGTKILFVGGLKPNKGHIHLLRAVAHYRREIDADVKLFLAGAADKRLGAYTAHLEGVIRSHGIGDNVVFAGAVSASELKTYFFLSDAFLCMSEHEGFCVPLVEAMCLRVPIVASAAAAVSETVEQAGLVWEEDDLELYAEGVRAICEQAPLRASLQTAGRRRYEEHFHFDVLSRRLLRLVEEAFD